VRRAAFVQRLHARCLQRRQLLLALLNARAQAAQLRTQAALAPVESGGRSGILLNQTLEPADARRVAEQGGDAARHRQHAAATHPIERARVLTQAVRDQFALGRQRRQLRLHVQLARPRLL
jgi:hypothetical protein